MAGFKDKAGRQWFLELDLPLIELLEARVEGFKVDELLGKDAIGLYALFDDAPRLVRVLWLMLESQAGKLGVVPEEFGRSLPRNVLDDAGDAFTDALVDFTPRHRRAGLRAVVAKVRQMQPEADKAMAAKVDRLVTARMAEALASDPTDEEPATPATSAAAFSESIPAPPG